ncbi:hypothetical protein [[Phormidium] sp. ETS-05]|uniref:hypothetical protein n=1 Tax=[Phormidium] sp. ETS-05 TaxID=222819 RepID=UPI0018EF0B11|nr:hypothetical protein [[Phormidium] sp. ETS-05]
MIAGSGGLTANNSRNYLHRHRDAYAKEGGGLWHGLAFYPNTLGGGCWHDAADRVPLRCRHSAIFEVE